MKSMRKLTVIAMAFAMMMAFTACGGNAGVANPVHETDVAGMVDPITSSIFAFGIPLPTGAYAAMVLDDVVYGYIDAASEDESAIAQVTFTLDGESYTYRAVPTAETELLSSGSDDMIAMEEEVNAAIEKGAALAGLHYDKWKTFGQVDVSYCRAIYAKAADKVSFIAWIDAVPGIMYSISADGVDQFTLMDVAAKSFVPAQGDK